MPFYLRENGLVRDIVSTTDMLPHTLCIYSCLKPRVLPMVVKGGQAQSLIHMFRPPLFILASVLLAPMDGKRLTMP